MVTFLGLLKSFSGCSLGYQAFDQQPHMFCSSSGSLSRLPDLPGAAKWPILHRVFTHPTQESRMNLLNSPVYPAENDRVQGSVGLCYPNEFLTNIIPRSCPLELRQVCLSCFSSNEEASKHWVPFFRVDLRWSRFPLPTRGLYTECTFPCENKLTPLPNILKQPHPINNNNTHKKKLPSPTSTYWRMLPNNKLKNTNKSQKRVRHGRPPSNKRTVQTIQKHIYIQ